jgi:hypothetical protein
MVRRELFCQRRSHVRTGQQGARELDRTRDGGPGAVGQADQVLRLFRLPFLDAQGNNGPTGRRPICEYTVFNVDPPAQVQAIQT